MDDPAPPPPRRSCRSTALILVACVAVGFGLRVLWVRHQMLSGDMFAGDHWPWERVFARETVTKGETGVIRGLGAYSVRFHTAVRGGLSDADVAALQRALHDESAIARVSALDVLLRTTSDWDPAVAIDALERTLDDDAAIPTEELSALCAGTSLESLQLANERWRRASPDRPLTPAAWATSTILDLGRPLVTFSHDLFADKERLREVEAQLPGPFAFTPGKLDDDRAAARARLARWRAALAAAGSVPADPEASAASRLVDLEGEPAWIGSAREAARTAGPPAGR